MLQTPRTGGRSRFSKALPMPPPTQNTLQSISPAPQVPRAFPGLPADMAVTTAFPARKDSVGARFAPKQFESPLPALPAKPSEPETQKKMPPIPRKAVASPPIVGSPPPPVQPAQAHATDAAKLKRNSSISSLLSAYSNTSSDSAPMYSQGSSVTKGSEASLSPERAAERDNMNNSYNAFSRNPYEEPSAQEKEMMLHAPLPPPPPMKDASRPTTPRVGLPATPRNGRTAAASSPKDVDDASSQITLTNASPPRREIWRRRASSKSDRNIAVSGLKLAISHGSTAATTAPLPAPDAGSSQSSLQHPASLNPMMGAGVNKTSPLPPRSTSALPGRNVKPQPQKPTAAGGSNNSQQVEHAAAPQPPTKDSPTVKGEVAPFPALPAKPSTGVASPLSSPEPPAKSIKRREIGTKPSLQNMRGKESDPAQHLREARSIIDLKGARNERAQRDAAQENFPFDEPHFQGAQAREGMPSPRGRRPSNPNAPRLAGAPQLTVTSPNAKAAPRELVEYKDQEPIQLTPQEEKDLAAAISKVINRNWDWPQAAPNKHGVWPCKEFGSDHINCISDHKRWLHMENFNNPIACMLCHEGSREHRRVCKSCGMRVCLPCADLLTGQKIEALDFAALASRSKGEEVATAA